MIPYVIQVFRIKSIPGSIPYQPGAGGASSTPATAFPLTSVGGFLLLTSDGSFLLQNT